MAERSWSGQASTSDDSEDGNVSTREADQNKRNGEKQYEEENLCNENQQYPKRNSEGTPEEFIIKKSKFSLPASSGPVATTQSTSNIFDIQSSLISASLALEYYKARDVGFHCLQAEFAQAKAETQQLAEKNKTIADDLLKTKDEVEFCKKKFQEKTIESEELRTRFALLERDLDCAREDNKRIYNEKEKMFHDLEYATKVVEYYKRIDHIKVALKSLAEFEGLNQVMHQNNNSDQGQTSRVGLEFSRERKYVLKIHEIDESMNCPICFEQWTASGDHSMCSLVCGHFFGKSCITNWINKTRTVSAAKCPQCLRSVKLKDIRNHYPPQPYVGAERI